MYHPIRTSGELGPVLRRLRRARKWSQQELGRRVGLSQERISAIERYPEKVTFDNLLTVMMALGASFGVTDAAAATHADGGRPTAGDAPGDDW